MPEWYMLTYDMLFVEEDVQDAIENSTFCTARQSITNSVWYSGLCTNQFATSRAHMCGFLFLV